MNVDKLRARFEDYCDKYAAISMRREEGILEITWARMAGRCNGEGCHMRNWKRPFSTLVAIVKTRS